MTFCVPSSGAPAEIFKPDADAGTADVCRDSEGSAAPSPRIQGTWQGVFIRLLPGPYMTHPPLLCGQPCPRHRGAVEGQGVTASPGTFPVAEAVGGLRPLFLVLPGGCLLWGQALVKCSSYTCIPAEVLETSWGTLVSVVKSLNGLGWR